MRSYNSKEIDLDRVGGSIEFVPTHALIGTTSGLPPLVMELGKSPNGLTIILYEDGTRGRVWDRNLVPILDK
jgi:hypothetical protein